MKINKETWTILVDSLLYRNFDNDINEDTTPEERIGILEDAIESQSLRLTEENRILGAMIALKIEGATLFRPSASAPTRKNDEW